MTAVINDRRNPDDSRDRLIRVEENLKHIDLTLQKIQSTLDNQSTAHIKEFKETNARVDSIEKRVDKIYWFVGLFTFVGMPTSFYILAMLLQKFGH